MWSSDATRSVEAEELFSFCSLFPFCDISQTGNMLPMGTVSVHSGINHFLSDIAVGRRSVEVFHYDKGL